MLLGLAEPYRAPIWLVIVAGAESKMTAATDDWKSGDEALLSSSSWLSARKPPLLHACVISTRLQTPSCTPNQTVSTLHT